MEPRADVAEALNGEGLTQFLYMGHFLFSVHAASRRRKPDWPGLAWLGLGSFEL